MKKGRVKKVRNRRKQFIVRTDGAFGGNVKYVLIEGDRYKCVGDNGEITYNIPHDRKNRKHVRDFLKQGVWREIPEEEVALL